MNQPESRETTDQAGREPRPPRDAKPGLMHSVKRFFLENNWFWVIAFLIIAFAVFTNHFRVKPPPLLPIGSVTPADVRAPFDLKVEDKVATDRRKAQAREKVKPVYDWDSGLAAELKNKVASDFAAAKSILDKYQRERKVHPLKTRQEKKAAESGLLDQLSEAMGGNLSRFAVWRLKVEGFSSVLEEAVSSVVAGVEQRKIVPTGESFQGYNTIEIRDIRHEGSEWEQNNVSKSEIITLARAKRLSGKLLEDIPHLSSQLRGAAEDYVRNVLRANLTYNSQETNLRRDTAGDNVQQLAVFLKKGHVLLKTGDKVDETVYQEILAYRTSNRRVANLPLLAAVSLFLLLLLAFSYIYIKSYSKKLNTGFNRFVLMLQVLSTFVLLSPALLVMMRFIAEGGKFQWMDKASSLAFVIPVAAGALLVTLLLDRDIAIVYTILFSFLFGVLMDFNYALFIFCLLSCITGIYAGTRTSQRVTQWKAGLIVGLVNIPLATAVLFTDSAWQDLTAREIIFPITLAFLAGFPITVMLTSFLLPFFESIFGILTEVRLLELSNLNHPLLKRLALEAPGTYNHSLVMAALSEAAANAVEANGLFCRVACYFHDVGKMLTPQYFVENQSGGKNPHNKILPQMSARILASHVKDGQALARQYKLPPPIVSIIPQHHGTRRIGFFLERAFIINDPARESLNENDYRYPGPKPQSREAAIIMMADGVEAGSRLLKNPSHQRARIMVDEITDRIIKDEQFDECDITFQDIAEVKEAFVKFVLGIYSKRVSYPDYAFDKDQKDEVQRSQAALQVEKPSDS